VWTYNSVGYGPWSAGMSFSTPVPALPGMATLSTPTGGPIGTYTPTYTWAEVTGATQYKLKVEGPSGTVIAQWYTAAEAVCSDDHICSVTPATALGGGAYTWYVWTYNSVGYGPWSAGMSFSTPVPSLPGMATLSTPTGGPIGTYTPTYTWAEVTGATQYKLKVDGPGGTVIAQWYTSVEAACSDDHICSVTPATALAGGAYTWYVWTYNSVGYGPWSSGTSFTR